MESPLEVLSRAVCMVQDNANESRLTTKELPTTKWRRDRRIRATASDYHQRTSSPVGSPNPQSPKPLTESTNTNLSGLSSPVANSAYECPIDMSVTSTTIKIRNSPPPPYREPLPGSTYANALVRPSVITQAPPKRNTLHHHSLISNRENDNLNSELNSTGDTVINEQSVDDHFAKALGETWKKLKAADKNVENLTTKKTSPTESSSKPQLVSLSSAATNLSTSSNVGLATSSSPPPPSLPPSTKTKSKTKLSTTLPNVVPAIHNTLPSQPKKSLNSVSRATNNDDSVSHSVDDHFAKALGDTWKKLQADKIARNDED